MDGENGTDSPWKNVPEEHPDRQGLPGCCPQQGMGITFSLGSDSCTLLQSSISASMSQNQFLSPAAKGSGRHLAPQSPRGGEDLLGLESKPSGSPS